MFCAELSFSFIACAFVVLCIWALKRRRKAREAEERIDFAILNAKSAPVGFRFSSLTDIELAT